MTVSPSNSPETSSPDDRTETKSPNRRYWIIGILLIVLLVALAIAPTYNRTSAGSTWQTNPGGYGAWYEYMQTQGAPIERWQRPLSELVEKTASDRPATLLRVVPSGISIELFSTFVDQEDWLDQGNQLILLGQPQAVTAAPFFSELASEVGEVAIATRRRKEEAQAPLLSDGYGAVVWEVDRDNLVDNSEGTSEASSGSDPEGNTEARTAAGRSIVSTTPFLAANAYLDAPGNFAFLAQLANEAGGPIWVDEYLHGYRDRDVVVEEVAGTWVGYLSRTPLLVAIAQAAVVLIVVLIAQNRRLGLRRSLPVVKTNNSEAYIKALAGVLHKADSRDFLVETLTQAEQKKLQKALGLGEAPVSLATLQTAWQQIGQNPGELNVLQSAPRNSSALRTWLQRLQSLAFKANRSAGRQANQSAQKVD
ncbi:DUF4350 domain-containing protein [cf. Phormidesmis sp. LEGE 11477]|uniref:DUF4350 domain-containing protein n=1 Tax=cf. Phormidesmis sp. LEGE 11477 TaxID=1828680 RepID=UPI001881A3BC|nr:DUF4350 domain-containing protein [cf. Phormidesmis sp. LEGE 11477]MBE9059611.1 DUF4350 domain-containing protein [cf. Phormidesmis sp. LEGE 11477]